MNAVAGKRVALVDDADLVRSLGAIPMFADDGAGGWREVWD